MAPYRFPASVKLMLARVASGVAGATTSRRSPDAREIAAPEVVKKVGTVPDAANVIEPTDDPFFFTSNTVEAVAAVYP